MTDWLAADFGPRLATTLVHFVWQGAVVAALLAALLRSGRLRRASSRYAACAASLLLLAVLPPLTFAVAATESAAVVEAKVAAIAGSDANAIAVHAPIGDAVANESSKFDLRAASPWIVAVWLIGVIAMGLRLCIGFGALRRLQRDTVAAPAEWNRLRNRLCRRLGLTIRPLIRLSRHVSEPCAAGYWRPIVLLPAGWLLDVPPDVLEAVLAHELAHIRRWDLWINLLQRMAETLLFYHPAVWWISRRMRVERELCCDEMAVAATGRRVQYAGALEFVARKRVSRDATLLVAGIGGGNMALLERVRNVLDPSRDERGRGWWPVGVLTLCVPIVLGGLAWANAASDRDDEPGANAVALLDDEKGERREPVRDEAAGEAERELEKIHNERRELERRERELLERLGRRPPVRPEGDRPPPPRRPDGDRPPGPPEGGPGRDGDRPPGPPPLRRDGDRPPGPPEGGPRREGDRPPGPPPLRRDGDRPDGPPPFRRPGPPEGDRPRFSPPPGPEGERRPDGPPDARRPQGPPEGGPRRDGDRPLPPPEARRDLPPGGPGDDLNELRREIERLRRELNELRGQRPPGPPGPPRRDGDREGGPRPEGERRPEGGPRPETRERE